MFTVRDRDQQAPNAWEQSTGGLGRRQKGLTRTRSGPDPCLCGGHEILEAGSLKICLFQPTVSLYFSPWDINPVRPGDSPEHPWVTDGAEKRLVCLLLVSDHFHALIHAPVWVPFSGHPRSQPSLSLDQDLIPGAPAPNSRWQWSPLLLGLPLKNTSVARCPRYFVPHLSICTGEVVAPVPDPALSRGPAAAP